MKQVIAYRSNTFDGLHTLMSDFDGEYDGRPRHSPTPDRIADLQKRHHLSTAHVFNTGNDFGEHVIFLDKVPALRAALVLADACWEDPKHLAVGALRGSWVLRLSDKGRNRVKYTNSIPAISYRRKSNAHRILLNTWFADSGLQIPWTPDFDRATTAPMASYVPHLKTRAT